MISKQQYEIQLQYIFRLLLQNKTQEEIAHELNISTRTVARYCQRIEKRYGDMQRQKTDNTLFTECQLFKNRMLTLYKTLETKALDYKTSGVEKAKCCEVAANIAIDVLKMESEGIRAVKEGLAALTNKKNNNTNLYNNNSHNNHNQQLEEEENDNRQF
jgi:hypothetical protein